MKSEKKSKETKLSNKEDQSKALDALVESLREKYGEESIMKLGETKRADVEVIASGSFSLDRALGVGGFPKGRIVEIFGPEMSGKSTLGLQVIAEA
ncbi:MAG TPA: DNA recombination/repair protein RecA, partial [Candidatus Colwellbacteria bacterium]|nr:DNA recombination/repair protein RecA [Candidatus Colwellbacteria bacterium]